MAGTEKNGGGELAAAIALLVRNEAALLAQQTLFLNQIAESNARIAESNARMDARMAESNARMAESNARMDARMAESNARMEKLREESDKRFLENEQRRLDSEARFRRIENKLEAIEALLTRLSKEVARATEMRAAFDALPEAIRQKIGFKAR
jgi:chromosome segregation ATPase